MKLYIPAIGDRLVLTKDWEFLLYLERRNTAFAKEHKLVDEKFGESYWDAFEDGRYGNRLKSVTASLPKGTTLEVDRVYIRTFNKSALKENEDYDSIS